MEPSCCFPSICLQVTHEFNKKATSKNFFVSIKMTATTPSQADHARWLYDPSAETPASTNNNNDKDLIERGLSLNSQRLINLWPLINKITNYEYKYNRIKVKNLNS